MAKIEVEQRGLITKDQFAELKQLFAKKGSFIDAKKRFSMIANTATSSVREVEDDLIDIKLRITNKKPELAVKHGKWSGKDSRREFNFFLERNQYEEMLEFLQLMGYNKFVIMANTKYDYLYNGVEFSLVEVPDWGYYFEAEISTAPDKAKAAEERIDEELRNLKLKVLGKEEYFELLDELNNRDGIRIDLNKDSFARIKTKFAEYF